MIGKFADKLQRKKERVSISLEVLSSSLSGLKENIKFQDGSEYSGVLRDGQPHGKGRFVGQEGTTYKGGFRHGRREGPGKLKNEQGRFVGGWKDDKFHGRGHFKWKNGTTYSGEFRNGRQSGHGKYSNKAEGVKYTGEFLDDQFHGYGTRTMNVRMGRQSTPHHANSSSAGGSLAALGPFTGAIMGRRGSLGLKSGAKDIYEGHWRAGKRHGEGEWVCGAARYKGQWQHDRIHGQGEYWWPRGDYYEGQWKDELRHGQGKLASVEGDVYTGEWKEGFRHGRGRFVVGDNKLGVEGGGDCYEGQWQYDRRHGQGKQSSGLGDVYEGEWRDNRKHGFGTDVQQIEIHAPLAPEAMDEVAGGGASAAVVSAQSASVAAAVKEERYEGQFMEGQRHGEGQVVLCDGSTYRGQWEQGQRCGHGMSIQPDFINASMGGDGIDGGGGRASGTGAAGTGSGSGSGSDNPGSIAGCAVYHGQWRGNRQHGTGVMSLYAEGGEGKDMHLAKYDEQPNVDDVLGRAAGVAGAGAGEVAATFSGGADGEGGGSSSVMGREGVAMARELGMGGSRYEGDWEGGTRHGYGRYTVVVAHDSGGSGSGSGTGSVTDAAGAGAAKYDMYVGSWALDQMEGRGRLQSSDGEIYEGEFKSGLKDGIGRLTTGGVESSAKERTVYTGEWKRGRKHGNGTWVSVTRQVQRKSTGSVVRGCGCGDGDGGSSSGSSSSSSSSSLVPQGEVEVEVEVEEVYEGGWRDNLKHGRGTLTRRDRGHGNGHPVVVQGYWAAGILEHTFMGGEHSHRGIGHGINALAGHVTQSASAKAALQLPQSIQSMLLQAQHNSSSSNANVSSSNSSSSSSNSYAGGGGGDASHMGGMGVMGGGTAGTLSPNNINNTTSNHSNTSLAHEREQLRWAAALGVGNDSNNHRTVSISSPPRAPTPLPPHSPLPPSGEPYPHPQGHGHSHGGQVGHSTAQREAEAAAMRQGVAAAHAAAEAGIAESASASRDIFAQYDSHVVGSHYDAHGHAHARGQYDHDHRHGHGYGHVQYGMQPQPPPPQNWAASPVTPQPSQFSMRSHYGDQYTSGSQAGGGAAGEFI